MQTHTRDSRKPAFRWLVYKGEVKNESLHKSNLNESRKRMFGNDITNTSFKRNKMDLFIGKDLNQNLDMKNQVENASGLGQVDKTNSNQEKKQSSTSYQFGPFAPVCVPKVIAFGNNEKQMHDWDGLATAYRPQYQNQGNILCFALQSNEVFLTSMHM